MRDDTIEPYQLLDADYGTEVPGLSDHHGYNPSWMGRLLSWQSRFVDRFALDVMEKAFLFGESADIGGLASEQGMARLQEMYAHNELLSDSELFYRAPSSPRRFRLQKLNDLSDGGERFRLRFESTYQTFDDAFCDEFGCHTANADVSAHVWRHHDLDRPTVICLHCWCGGYLRIEERIFAARRLYEERYNVVVVTLPFHGERTPTDALFSGQFFPSPDLRRTNEAFGQAVSDVSLLTNWLRDEGFAGPIGLMGISLGGYVTSLLASLSDTYDFAVPIIAPASFADILWWHGTGRDSQSRFASIGVDREFLRDVWAVHCPLSYELEIPKERVLIVAGAGDEVVRPAQSLALWKHWDEPELRWFAGSHLGHVRWVAGSIIAPDALDFMSPAVDWLAELEFD
jgi:dienelactone hydrolase